MKRRTVRAVTGLLCAALLLSNMTDIRAFAMEETGQEIQMQEHSQEDGTREEEDVKTEQTEETEQAGDDAEPETDDREKDTDEGDPKEEEQDKEGSAGEPETGSEGSVEERPEEADAEDAAKEQPEGETAVTVSGNTVEEASDADDSQTGEFFFPQVYSSGKSFMVEGKTYNSEDADATYSAGDDITAYYYEADSLIYFDGTGPMKDWSTPVTRPWNSIRPTVCVIGEGITTVGLNAFYWPSHSLKSVSLPGTLRVINNFAFQQNSDMDSLILPDGLERIGERAFLGCHALTSIDIPGSVTDLGKEAFYECRSAAAIYVPGSIREIKEMTFSGCKAAVDITISEGVEIIGEGAFQSIAARSVVLPEGVKQIGDNAFTNATKLTSITIPDSVTEIGGWAFAWCNSLLRIHIGTGVASIGTNAFAVGTEKKFTLESENETAWAYDWTGDKRVIAYRITFMDRDGLPLLSDFVGMGEKTLTYAPQMEDYSTKEAVYTFTGWEPEITEETVVDGDAEYKPVYESTAKKYLVQFKDHDGTKIADLELPYGTDLYSARPDDPQRKADAHHTYTFSGWSPAITEGTKVTKAAEYTAQYTAIERLYTLTFLDYDGSTLKEVEKPYGTVIADEAPTPERASDGEHSYTFTGWQPAIDEGDILTADTAYEAVYSSEQKQCRVVFQNHDGSVLKSFSVPYGDTISDRAPVASRVSEGLNSYTFAGWQPALEADAPVRGDITYTALYTRKTQTGISVEHDVNHPCESGISGADIRVYPVYEIYDPSGDYQEKVTDRTHPVDVADITLSKDKLAKGDNEVEATQDSTGFTALFHIYGSFIDGIFAVPVDAEVKTGTKISRVTVYFTRNRMEGNGEILRGVVDRAAKVERYTLNNGASSVTIAEGDNEIRITEKETGENHSCTVHITGVGKGEEKESDDKNPADDDRKPDGETEKEPSPEPDIWQIVLDIPKVEGKPADIRHYAVVWDNTGEETGALEAAEPFREILQQVETAEESGETETFLPEIQEPEVQEQDVTVSEEQPVTGAEPEVKTEEPREERLPLWLLPAVFAFFGVAALAVMLFKKRKQRFHGILTWEENASIEISNPKECLETVQEVIDRTETLADCMKKLKESGAKTCIPVSACMEVIYTDGDGETQVIESAASEKKMIRILSSIHENERAGVRIYHEQAGIDIHLKYKL